MVTKAASGRLVGLDDEARGGLLAGADSAELKLTVPEYLSGLGVELSGEQQIKPKTALQFFAGQIESQA